MVIFCFSYFPAKEEEMVLRKSYPAQNDFIAVLGRNSDGWLQLKLFERIFSLAGKMRFFVNQAFAQMIHDRVAWHPTSESRQDSDWFAAERVILKEYDATDFLNIAVKCLLFKACWKIKESDFEFPDFDRIMTQSEDGSFAVGFKFAYFLDELATNRIRILHVFAAAADENSTEITFNDVDICVRMELENLFRQKEKGGYKWHGS